MEINKDSAMLIDVQYMKGNRKEKIPDYLYIIWKDLDTGKKYLKVIITFIKQLNYYLNLNNHKY